jgi:two-component system, response regulator PdtaR
MKVLIVDDEPLVRRSLARAFQVKGYQVIEAHDGKSGLELWTKELPDIAFVDVLMPVHTGPQLIELLAEEIRIRTKIVIMSAYTGDFSEHLKKSQDFQKFVLKPFNDVFDIVKMAEELMNSK